MARLTVYSHKLCWQSSRAASGYATDGGFPFQMQALSELFEATTLVVPCSALGNRLGEIPLTGHNLGIAPLSPPRGSGLRRKLALPLWAVHNSPILIRQVRRADAVHAPIPGDIGTIGMLLAFVLGKPLFVRHCGNWSVQKTRAEHFWKWFMERVAGGRNVMLVTGGAPEAPSDRNPAIRWIFSTSLTERELKICSSRRGAPEGGRARLIIVCRQIREKGTGVVIESLPNILQSFPGVVLDVVGDGSALEEFKKLAAALGVADRTIFHGKVDHGGVIRLLQNAHLFCYPTAASEGFPKVVLEALACGLPVISTRISVLPQLIGTGCGLLINESTPATVAHAVCACLSNPDLYRSMSAQAVETASHYSLQRWQASIGDSLRTAWGSLRPDG